MDNTRFPRAGAAFLETLKDDPGAVEALARAKRDLEAAIDELRKGHEADALQWEARFGEPFPETIEDWERWAARVGASADWIIEGEWTGATVLPLIEGYLQRCKDAKTVAGPTPEAPSQDRASAGLPTPATDVGTPRGRGGAKHRRTCDQEMESVLQTKPESQAWSVTQFVVGLDHRFGRSTIAGCKTWKKLVEQRKQAQIARLIREDELRKLGDRGSDGGLADRRKRGRNLD